MWWPSAKWGMMRRRTRWERNARCDGKRAGPSEHSPLEDDYKSCIFFNLGFEQTNRKERFQREAKLTWSRYISVSLHNSSFFECQWSEDEESEGCEFFWENVQMRQNWTFGRSHQLYVCLKDSFPHLASIKTLYLLLNLEAGLCFGLWAMNISWNDTYCSLSEITGLVSANKIMVPTQTAISPQEWPDTKTFDRPEVAVFEPWSKCHWISMERAETCSVKRAPFRNCFCKVFSLSPPLFFLVL